MPGSYVALYDQFELDNLRCYSSLYFHGHSVGGTNPSLLEAMACGCRIAAHDNRFNRAVLQDEADHFQDSNDVAAIINAPSATATIDMWKKLNLDKIRTTYNHEKIVDDYEELMLNACGIKKMIVHQTAAAAI